jgi:hypothetical protein
MKVSRLLSAVVLSLFVGSIAPAAMQPPPKAKQWQSTFTGPVPGMPVPAIQITKASKIKVKPGSNNVTFSLKLAGVTNIADDTPVTNVMNTLQVDVQVLGTFQTLNFTFAITNGKNVEKSFSVTNASLPTAPSAGAAMEVLGARVISGGKVFGVSGITLK